MLVQCKIYGGQGKGKGPIAYKQPHDNESAYAMLDTVHDSVCIAINAFARDFFLALINKVNVPMFDKQQA